MGILTKAKNNKGVKEAAQGEITLTAVEAEMTTQSATKAPTEAPIMPPSAEKLAGSDTSTASPDASSDSGADDDTSTGLSPTPAPDADDDTSTGLSRHLHQILMQMLSMRLSALMLFQGCFMGLWWLC